MVILLGFLLPAVVVFLAGAGALRFAGKPHSGRVGMLALAAGAVSAVATYGTVRQAPIWSERDQIAWIGLESQGDHLTIGGPRDSALVGWPGGRFWPAITFTAAGEDHVAVAVTPGAGVVQIGERVLGAAPFARDTALALGAFELRQADRMLLVFRDGRQIGDVELRWSPNRVVPLPAILEPIVLALRASAEERDRETAGDLAHEARRAHVFFDERRRRVVLRARALWLIAAERAASVDPVPLPARLTVRWTDRRVDVEVRRDADGRLAARFLRPWPLQSPLPFHDDRDASVALVVSGEPRAGEHVFRLPLGGLAPIDGVPVTLHRGPSGLVFGPWRLPLPALPPGVVRAPESPEDRHVTSRARLAIGDTSLVIGTVEDRPSSLSLVASLALALVVLGIGLLFIAPRHGAHAWFVPALVLATWNLLMLRLLLAVRFGLDPARLSAFSVERIAMALAGLVLVPALLCLVARLYRDQFVYSSGRRWFMSVAGYIAGVSAAALAQLALGHRFWPDLPSRLQPSLGLSDLILGAIWVAGVLVLIWEAKRVYLGGSATSPMLWVRAIVFDVLPRLWAVLAGRWRLRALAAVLVPLAVCAVALAGADRWAPSVVFTQEVLTPIVMVGLPGLFWLSARVALVNRAMDPRALPRPVSLAVLGAGTVAVPILYPALLGDPGGVLTNLSLFVVLGLLLVAGRPRRFGAVVLGASGGVLAGLVAIGIWMPSFALGVAERAVARLLAFFRGSEALSLLMFTQAGRDTGDGLWFRSLQNSIEHVWENQAAAHLGGWTGQAFGGMDVSLSMVPQRVLQFDSTFSFFVLGDHGWVGGMSLLALYALPPAIVLWNARRHFDVGHGLALLVTSALLLDAALHAAMNLGILPFSGRNLPLLSANSSSDLLRWALLLAVALQAALWRTAGGDDLPSPIYRVNLTDSRPARTAGWLGVSGAAVILAIGLAGAVVVSSDRYGRPFSLRATLEVIDGLIADGRIAWNTAAQRVDLSRIGIRLTGRTLLEQEAARFDYAVRRDADTPAESAVARLADLRTVDDYDHWLDDMRRAHEQASPDPRPLLFYLRPHVATDGGVTAPVTEVRLAVNPAFNVVAAFDRRGEPAAMPTVTMADGGVLIGPGWANDRWVLAPGRATGPPWLPYMRAIVSARWLGGLPPVGAGRTLMLTLDPALQQDAMTRTAAWSRAGHRAALRRRPESDPDRWRQALPPRVALAVVELPGGGVRALGGAPATAPGPQWLRTPDGWQPPVRWVDSAAPPLLAAVYRRDRNFDPIEMGSATKPIWAAAVLGVHAGLDSLLQTRGDGNEETTAFGLDIGGPPWDVSATGAWRDFGDYLAHSDNRYHVRLGLLGLAAPDGSRIAADPGAGSSPSTHESLAGRAPRPWRQYPAFPADLRLSVRAPRTIGSLHRQPLAERLSRFFGVSVAEADRRPYRRSFWTLDEHDDLRAAGPRVPLDGVSPETTRLALDSIASARDYVSLLLGGATNRWPNVDFAAAFATAVTGHPVAAHVTDGSYQPATSRQPFPDIARRLRPGLAAVLTTGTASRAFRETRAAWVIASLTGVRAYAKTGTISLDGGRTVTSRLAVALIRWKDEPGGQVDRGLAFSLVIERTQAAEASRRLAEFLVAQEDYLRRFFAK